MDVDSEVVMNKVWISLMEVYDGCGMTIEALQDISLRYLLAMPIRPTHPFRKDVRLLITEDQATQDVGHL